MQPRTAWFLACRPKTLPVSVSPVLVGTAAAWLESGQWHWAPFLVAALSAMLIQIGANLFNDAGDFLQGLDQPGRLGPPRASAEGWLSAAAVRRGAWLAFALAFLCGIYLVWRGGWPIVAIGLASLLAGWAYTGGPWPIARGPWGEVFVWLFFGLIAVAGSHYLQTLTLSPLALGAGALLGLHAAAVLTVNNYRDLESDAAGGRRTLAVRWGRDAMRRLYAAEMLLPFVLLPMLPWLAAPAVKPALAWGMLLLTFAALPAALGLVVRFRTTPPGRAFNAILAATASLQLFFAGLLAMALALIGAGFPA